MLFWGLHCNSKFNESTIGYALDYNTLDVERELESLVEAGIIDKDIEEGVTLYCLTLDEEKRRPIIAWARPGHSST